METIRTVVVDDDALAWARLGRVEAHDTDCLAWLDATMQARDAGDFADASASDQTALLAFIIHNRNTSPELDPGIDFFALVRRMTVDGFYMNRIRMRDIYLGNTPAATFSVPREAIDYALARSPLIH
jgi:gluconate 2-dehydrogenase gamma chain